MSGTMFLRSCASVFRQCVKASPRPLLSRTIHTSRLNRSSDKMENGVDYSKGVTIVLEKSDGSTLEEIVNRKETLYDVVKRVDPMGKVFLGFGQCGGCTDCATCHVFLEERYSKLQPLKDEEDDILVGVPEYSEKFSRLGCCVHITEEMDGMVVKFPSILGDFCELEQNVLLNNGFSKGIIQFYVDDPAQFIVTIHFRNSDGDVMKETGYVNERVYDLVDRVDKDRERFVGYGVCGGQAVCATCLLVIDEMDYNKLEPPRTRELDVLDTIEGNTELIRLGCQLHLTEVMNGMVFQLPSLKDIIIKDPKEE